MIRQVSVYLQVGQNQDAVIGRGRLPDAHHLQKAPLAVYLRMERTGEHVRALCSVDGEMWFLVGETRFAVDEPIQVGVYANGEIYRSVHPGAFVDGTAIRFLSFQQWGPSI